MKKIIIFILALLLLCNFTYAAAGDCSKFINATGGTTACVGGNSGIVNATGNIISWSNICFGLSCYNSWASIFNNPTINASVNQINITSPPAECPSDTFMTQFTGMTSTCESVPTAAGWVSDANNTIATKNVIIGNATITNLTIGQANIYWTGTYLSIRVS